MLRRQKQPPPTIVVSQPEERNGSGPLSSSNAVGRHAMIQTPPKKKSSLFRSIIIVSFWVFILGVTILVPRFTITNVDIHINSGSNNKKNDVENGNKSQQSKIQSRKHDDYETATTSDHQVIESDNTMQQQSQSQSQRQQQHQPQEAATDSHSNPEFHLVFSTGCSLYQDWQSYVFFYHVYKVSQHQQQQNRSNNIKNVTRIVSGCSQQQQELLQQTHYEQIQSTMSSNFLLHFTPDYSNIQGPNVQSYKYFNKPFGMKHWMEHRLGYSNNTATATSTSTTTVNPYDDVIIVLLDPDQLLLRPFTHDYTTIRMDWTRKGYNTPNSNVSKIVKHGKTITQTYAFGDDYTALNLTHVLLHEPNNGGKDSPLWTMSKKQKLGYAAGPPYLATAKDFYTLANKWSELVPRVHDVYPYLLAEMYAYW